ncbi:MAG: hypothetical protein RLZZ01_628 [Actinomycetota bacterium]
MLLFVLLALLPAGPLSANGDGPASVPDTSTPAPPSDDLGTVSGGSEIDGGVDVTLPLVPVPVGCEAPDAPHVVFVGPAVSKDDRSVRFGVESVRAGSVAPYGLSDPLTGASFVDVRYGLDTAMIDEGERYLVGAAVDPDLGLLLSKVEEPIQDFGGDEVIGVSESDLDCPDFEDPVRTLRVDGTEIEHGLFDGFFGAGSSLVLSLVVPLTAAFAVVFLLAMFRLGVAGVVRGLRQTGRAS